MPNKLNGIHFCTLQVSIRSVGVHRQFPFFLPANLRQAKCWKSAGRSNLWLVNSRHINGVGDSGFRIAKTDQEWLALDEKVNTYPSARTFKAVGHGGQEFVDAMVGAVERVTENCIDRRAQVSERPSAQGKYLAVSIRKVLVQDGRQVLRVYHEMRKDGRVKYIL